MVAINPTGSTGFGQSKHTFDFSSGSDSTPRIYNSEFTDAIAQDWGGAPFVDMQNGWKYALEHFPEVIACSSPLVTTLTCFPMLRSIPTVPLRQEPVGADMLSSEAFFLSLH